MKNRSIMLSFLTGTLFFIASTATLYAESFSFADISWTDNKEKILEKLRKNEITASIKTDAGGFNVANEVFWYLIPQIVEFRENVLKEVDDDTRSRIQPIRIFAIPLKHPIVQSFYMEISDIGNKVPLYYRITLQPKKGKDILEVLEKKYGKFKEMEKDVGDKDSLIKYVENNDEFLIYRQNNYDNDKREFLTFLNLNNIKTYIPEKIEQIKFQDKTDAEATKDAAKDLF